MELPPGTYPAQSCYCVVLFRRQSLPRKGSQQAAPYQAYHLFSAPDWGKWSLILDYRAKRVAYIKHFIDMRPWSPSQFNADNGRFARCSCEMHIPNYAQEP